MPKAGVTVGPLTIQIALLQAGLQLEAAPLSALPGLRPGELLPKPGPRRDGGAETRGLSRPPVATKACLGPAPARLRGLSFGTRTCRGLGLGVRALRVNSGKEKSKAGHNGQWPGQVTSPLLVLVSQS
jgi:hypothetical protein